MEEEVQVQLGERKQKLTRLTGCPRYCLHFLLPSSKRHAGDHLKDTTLGHEREGLIPEAPRRGRYYRRIGLGKNT